jgi:hypothetical protein
MRFVRDFTSQEHTKASAKGLGPRDNDHDINHQAHLRSAAPSVSDSVAHFAHKREQNTRQLLPVTMIMTLIFSHTYLLQHQE